MANKNSIADKYLAQADNAIAAMTGVGSAAASGAASAAAAASEKAAAGADKTVKQIGETVDTMKGIAGSLLPQAEKISGDAATVRGIAGGNLTYSVDWLKQAEGLRNMDENAGGISGEFVKLYKQLDPALQISLAASDARKEAQSQTDSAVRSLQRAGVSPTAAALATIRERAAASTAALVAAVKTKARQSGITMQMEALEKGVSMAIAQAGIGKQFTDSATEGYKSAAQLEQLSGSLKTGAASIYGSSASLLADAQNLVQAAAAGKIQASSVQVNAAQAAIQAFATAAEYYSTQASSFRGLDEEGENKRLL